MISQSVEENRFFRIDIRVIKMRTHIFLESHLIWSNGRPIIGGSLETIKTMTEEELAAQWSLARSSNKKPPLRLG